MLLKEFLDQYRRQGQPYLETFEAPFLLEEGRLDLEGSGPLAMRRAFYLKPPEEGEGSLLVGRKPPASVQVLDRNVSGTHAMLVPPEAPGTFWTILDLGSTNGTYVNGHKLPPNDPHMLTGQSVIGLGPTLSFVFLEPVEFATTLVQLAAKLPREPEPPREPLDLEHTIADHHALDGLGGAVAPKPPGSEAPAVTLYVECQPFGRVPLPPGGRVVVGRSPDKADLVMVGQKQISRTHAAFAFDGKRVTVQDLNSSNGVTVDGVRIPASGPFPLDLEAKVQLDRFTIELSTGAGVEGTSTIVLDPKGEASKKKVIKGSFESVSLGQILAGIEDKAKSGRMSIHADDVSGELIFHAGKPWRASTSNGLEGTPAIRALLQLKAGMFAIDPTPRDPGEQQITESFSELVLTDFFESS
jgi:pSer/pThr/pTyr-binding forkhead associated (FHA) protein